MLPNRVMISPGATGPGAKLAALVTDAIEGVATLCVAVTGIFSGTRVTSGTTEITPEFTPGDNKLVFTDTVKTAGVVPVAGVTTSQGVLVETEKLTAAPVLPTATDWEGFGSLPWTANVRAPGDTVAVDAEETFRVTPTVIAPPGFPTGVTVTLPLYVPPGRPAGFAVTEIAAGAAAEPGVTTNQFPPVNVVAVTLIGVGGELVFTVSVCELAMDPAVTLNTRGDGVTEMVAEAVTVSVTGIVNGELTACDVTTTEPVYVPAASVLVLMIDIVSVAGVEPVIGVTASQFPPV